MYIIYVAAFPQTDSESDLSSLERNSALRSPLSRRRGTPNKPAMHRVTSPQIGRRALSPISVRSEPNTTQERKSNSLPRIVFNRVNMDTPWEGSNGSSSLNNTSKDLFILSNHLTTIHKSY